MKMIGNRKMQVWIVNGVGKKEIGEKKKENGWGNVYLVKAKDWRRR